jgi:hypothetical protein
MQAILFVEEASGVGIRLTQYLFFASSKKFLARRMAR